MRAYVRIMASCALTGPRPLPTTDCANDIRSLVSSHEQSRSRCSKGITSGTSPKQQVDDEETPRRCLEGAVRLYAFLYLNELKLCYYTYKCT